LRVGALLQHGGEGEKVGGSRACSTFAFRILPLFVGSNLMSLLSFSRVVCSSKRTGALVTDDDDDDHHHRMSSSQFNCDDDLIINRHHHNVFVC